MTTPRLGENNMMKSSHLARLSTLVPSLPPDLWLVSSEGFHLPTNRFLLALYAPDLNQLISSSSSSSSLPTSISIPMPALSVSLLLTLLTTGNIAQDSVFSPLDLLQTAELLGIDLGDIEIINSSKSSSEDKNDSHIKAEIAENERICKDVDILPPKRERDEAVESPCVQTESQKIAMLEANFLHDGINFTCKQCDHTTDQSESLMKHLKSHRDIKYKCTRCEFISNKYHLKSHIKAKHTEQRYDCTECEFSTPYKKDLWRHFNKKHGSNFIYLQCDQCFYKTDTKRRLERHILNKHGKSEPENSEDWDEKLAHAMNQNKPVMPEFSKENGEFSCLDCPYSTVLLQNMKNHWIFHNPTLYECKACGIEHSSAKFLRRHIKENHDQ